MSPLVPRLIPAGIREAGKIKGFRGEAKGAGLEGMF